MASSKMNPVTAPMAREAGVMSPENLKAMQDANAAAAKEGKPAPYLSLNLNQPPPHKKGNWFSALFSGNEHPDYIKLAANKIMKDPDSAGATAAQEKTLAYMAAHTAPIEGMERSAEEALRTTPAPRMGFLKGTIPHAPALWGHADATGRKIKDALVLKTKEKHATLGHLIDTIGDNAAKTDIKAIFASRFQQQKRILATAERARAAALKRSRAIKNKADDAAKKTRDAGTPTQLTINGGRRKTRSRRARKGKRTRRGKIIRRTGRRRVRTHRSKSRRRRR